ncbi:3'-5' exonuclease [Flavobacterium sp.]|uniref:3'-5' exonuclease n=1 Tax=Flavobacterium sp. TaxID=239 RepID=UPI002FDB5A00
MLHWFKKITKETPKFWDIYLSYFSETQTDLKSSKRYVIFDCETTGLDPKKDVILSIGAVAVLNDAIIVSDYFEVFVQQETFNVNTVPIHGILKEGKEEKIVEAEAVIQFLHYIKNATLVGHNVRFDIEMINQSLKRLNLGKLKNDSMDTDAMYQKFKGLQEDQHSSLDELCSLFKIQKSDRHTASGDAYITALLFLKLKKRLQIP